MKKIMNKWIIRNDDNNEMKIIIMIILMKYNINDVIIMINGKNNDVN